MSVRLERSCPFVGHPQKLWNNVNFLFFPMFGDMVSHFGKYFPTGFIPILGLDTMRYVCEFYVVQCPKYPVYSGGVWKAYLKSLATGLGSVGFNLDRKRSERLIQGLLTWSWKVSPFPTQKSIKPGMSGKEKSVIRCVLLNAEISVDYGSIECWNIVGEAGICIRRYLRADETLLEPYSNESSGVWWNSCGI